jgi:hypothetical protein
MQGAAVTTRKDLLLGGVGLYQGFVPQQRDEAVELAIEFLHPIDHRLGRFHR